MSFPPSPVGRAMAHLFDYVPLAILALAWEAIVRGGLVSPSVLPPFSEVVAEFFRLAGNGVIFVHAAISLRRIVIGLALAVAFGVTAGLLMSAIRPVRLVLQPLLGLLYPLPKSALVPLLMLLLGLGDSPKILLIFIGCLLPVVTNTFNGARGVDEKLMWSAANLGASRLGLFVIRFNAALPDILTGARTGVAFAFILLINAELIFGQDGLGYLIASTGGLGAYPTMFAAVILVVMLGFAADRLFGFIENRMLAWRAP
ncbi:MAG TPA: ABC transporter permease [Ensifer sp.]|nr:ABC transporter permease [Ensifer sp.]